MAYVRPAMCRRGVRAADRGLGKSARILFRDFYLPLRSAVKVLIALERKRRKPIHRTQPRSLISSRVEKLFSAKSYTTYVAKNKQKSEEAQTASISARLDGVL